MPQFNATFQGLVNVEGLVTDEELPQLLIESTAPIKQLAEAKADAIDESPLDLTATSANTTFAHDPKRPNRKVFLNVSTTFSPTPPPGGWREDMGGKVIIVFKAANLDINFSGIVDPALALTAEQKGIDRKIIGYYTIVDGDVVWEFKLVNTTTAVVPRRYYAKGNPPNGNILVPTYNTATPPAPLVTHDSGLVSYLFSFRANPAEKTNKFEILFSKGAAGSGTSQAIILPNSGFLDMGMGNAPEEKYTFQENVMDNEIHFAGFSFAPGTTNNGVLTACLDGVINSRSDIPNMVYNTAAISFFSLAATQPERYGTASKMYYWYKFNRILTQKELMDAQVGIIPSGWVVGYTFKDNANDLGPNGINGVVTDGIIFGNEILS